MHGPLTLTAPMATRLWGTFIFFYFFNGLVQNSPISNNSMCQLAPMVPSVAEVVNGRAHSFYKDRTFHFV